MGIGIILDLIILFALVGGVLEYAAWFPARPHRPHHVVSGHDGGARCTACVNWFGANVGGGAANRTSGPYVFGFMIIVFYEAFEYMVNRNYPDCDSAPGRGTISWRGSHLPGRLAIGLVLLTLDFWTVAVGRGGGGIPDLAGDLLATSWLTVFPASSLFVIGAVKIAVPGRLAGSFCVLTR
jgi:hypothetical protein